MSLIRSPTATAESSFGSYYVLEPARMCRKSRKNHFSYESKVDLLGGIFCFRQFID